MPLEHNAPGSPQDWLRHAISDLNLACIEKPKAVLWENLCFHAQQSVEKSLKALCVHQGIAFPKTHNLRILLDLIESIIDVPDEIDDAASLTDYAVTSRYPGEYTSVDEKEYLEAVQLARTVYNWVKGKIE